MRIHPRTRLRPARVGRVLCFATLALVLAACADDPVGAPLAPEAPLLSQTAGYERAERVPNHVPYRAAGYTHGTGRSGGAELTARALLGMDGRTVVEVTTGELDSGAPGPLALQQLQVKLLTDAGDAIGVENHNRRELGGAGSVSYIYEHILRHWSVQVQANIRTPNVQGRDRTGVVTVTERVNLRPDPAVENLSVEPEVAPGSFVPVSADVMERNGDLGARYDLVLYLNGVEVDRVGRALVQEGDRVSHAFAALHLTEPGTYEVEARVEGVTPGDWDTSNNTASATVVVQDVAEPFDRGRAVAGEVHGDASRDREGTWSGVSYWGPYTYTIDSEDREHLHYQQQSAWGVVYSVVDLPVTVEVEADLAHLSHTFSTPTSRSSNPYTSRWCAREVFTRPDGNVPGVSLNVCVVDYDDQVAYLDHSRVEFSTVAGRALYISTGYAERTGSSPSYHDMGDVRDRQTGGELAAWSDNIARASVWMTGSGRTLGYDFEVSMVEFRQEAHMVRRSESDPGIATGVRFFWEYDALGDCSDPGNWTSFDSSAFATYWMAGEQCDVFHSVIDRKQGFQWVMP